MVIKKGRNRMRDRNQNNFFKGLSVGMLMVILIGLMVVSGSVAEWSPENNSAWFSGLFNTPFSSFNMTPFYRGAFNNNPFPAYGSSFSSGLFSFPGLSYGNTYGGLYAGLTGFNNYVSGIGSVPFYSIPGLSFNPSSYMGTYPLQGAPPITLPYTQLYSPIINVTPQYGNTLIIPVPNTKPESKPYGAPKNINGTWQSQESEEEGGLKVDRNNMLLTMEGSSLPLGEGSLTEFDYTPTFKKAPISFKATFESGYTAEFSGTANNALGSQGRAYWYYSRETYNFKVEGEYVVKDDSGNVADAGTFNIIGYLY